MPGLMQTVMMLILQAMAGIRPRDWDPRLVALPPMTPPGPPTRARINPPPRLRPSPACPPPTC